MLYLSEEAKLGIVSGAIAILILMVICMVCKLSRLHKQPVYKDSSYLKGTADKNAAGKVPVVQFPKFADECSDCEQEKRSKMNGDIELQTSQGLSPPRSKGKIKFTMVYQSDLQILLLTIIEASQLVGKDFWDTVDSYVKVRLQPDEEGILRRQTDVFRKSTSPKYGESYEFNMLSQDVQSSTLHLSVWEIDKYSRHHMIGEVQVELGQVIKADEAVAFDRDLRSSQKVSANHKVTWLRRSRNDKFTEIRQTHFLGASAPDSSRPDSSASRLALHRSLEQTVLSAATWFLLSLSVLFSLTRLVCLKLLRNKPSLPPFRNNRSFSVLSRRRPT